MEKMDFIINGQLTTVEVEPNWTLLHILRDVLDLTGAKCGCNTGDCGSCKVIIDGEAVNSCLVSAKKAVGKHIQTVEGLEKNGQLHPLQKAFIEEGAVQCGYCTPGMLMSAKALLDKNPNPTELEIRSAINNNLCRCTGYATIINAIKAAACAMNKEKGEWHHDGL